MTKPLNRYSPHYDHDEECVTMGLDDNGDWVHVVRVRAVLKERDEARAEVEQLREKIKAFAWEAQDLRAKNANLLADWRANQRRSVAERQREACASEARFYAGLGCDGEKVEEKVRATPLVTEVES